MKKNKVHFLLSFIAISTCLWITKTNLINASESNSQKWCNEEIQDMVIEYEHKYNCDLKIANKDFEKSLEGIWQTKEFVGYDRNIDFPWDGLNGNVYIFCENAWIEEGRPSYKPVYVCYTTNMEEIASEELFNISWIDNRYENCEGILVLGINSERSNMFGSAVDYKKMEFIICKEKIIMKKSNSYFELEKVGDIEMYEHLTNVK